MKNVLLGQLEKEIMDFIWSKNQPVTVRIVYESISKKRKIAYTTIMTVMGRLVEKDLLNRSTSGKAYIYKEVDSKDKFLTKSSHQIIKNFMSNFGDTAVVHFVHELEKLPIEKKRKFLRLLKKAHG